MITYEFITPSDLITFKAENDKIAFACSIILGEGKAGCKNLKDDKSLGTILIFDKAPMDTIKEFLGVSLDDFIDSNKQEIAKSFESFAYGNRKNYDLAISSITDPDKLTEFKKQHEDQNRSSISKWVLAAWKYGKALKEETK